MIRDPTKPKPLSLDEKISERFSGFSILVERGCDPDKCKTLLTRSLYSIFSGQLNEQSMKSWLSSPKAIGGFGLVPVNFSGLALSITEAAEDSSRPRVPPTGIFLSYLNKQISDHPILSTSVGAFEEQMADRLGLAAPSPGVLSAVRLPLPVRMRAREMSYGMSSDTWCAWHPAQLLDPVLTRSAVVKLLRDGYPRKPVLTEVLPLSSAKSSKLLRAVWGRWSRRLVLDLVSDRLPRPGPRCLGVSDTRISLVCNWLSLRHSAIVLSHHRVTSSDFLRFTLLIERLAGVWCERELSSIRGGSFICRPP